MNTPQDEKIEVFSDEFFMKAAFQEAISAYEKNEVPVGAVVVSRNKIVARGHNLTQTLNDVTAHAEMIAITSASNHLGSKYLENCALYVTLEPCPMCAGALFWSQIKRVVFAASDEKRGFRHTNPKMLHPKTMVDSGIMADECQALLKDFFRQRRKD